MCLDRSIYSVWRTVAIYDLLFKHSLWGDFAMRLGIDRNRYSMYDDGIKAASINSYSFKFCELKGGVL